jgi:uncharacterized damage-inducible protein DinB
MAIKDGMIMELKYEGENTRKMLERVPYEKATYKPHEKSRALTNEAFHIANIASWIGRISSTPELDVSKPGAIPKTELPKNKEELLALFDKNQADALKHLEGASDEALMTPWTLRNGDHVIFTLPKAAAIRNLGLNHTYHHRGQMSVYLRLLDVPVPGMYGPSADDEAKM